ncbi:Transcriptional regulator, PadR family [hydrothermal vent metagenome]|uniref:Transcriptional regulator, PadR family n=1 Tax=hydrothermal vent metagenome TaxID=652676 RepID=A0A3B0TUE2_9ZZZZ
MNVATLCLAILQSGETTGYEIRKMSTEGEYAYFVDASYGSIYPALARLQADGMVTCRIEQQTGRPAKKVYSITKKGRQTFHQSLFNELDDDVFRSEFLLFARFATDLPASLVKKRLNERIEAMNSEIKQLKDIQDDKTTDADKWVIDYGIKCLTVAREHVASHMNELIGLAQPDDIRPEAAE